MFLILLILIVGCSSQKYTWPAQAAAGYFGHLALHEYSHAQTAEHYGARDISVNLLPESKDDRFYIGRTEYRSDRLSDSDSKAVSLSGPYGSFAASVISRTSLRLGLVPKELQASFGWTDIFGRLGSYFQGIAGLSQRKSFDLGKENIWYSIAFLSVNILYDVISWIAFDEKPERYFGVLFGQEHYDEPGHSKKKSSLEKQK